MRGLMLDHNIEGHFRSLIAILETYPLGEVWNELGLAIETFSSLGLPSDANDTELWKACQLHELVLFTANRNDDGPDSLEATIRQFNCETSLPVLTLANPLRFSQDRNYAVEVAERMLEYLLEIQRYLGAGRIYL